MLGTGHAASGLAAGAAGVAWILPATGYVVPGGAWSVAVLGTMMAGACLFPDVDTENATAANAFGPASKAVHHVAAATSVAVMRFTGTRRDEAREHRGFTHTIVFAALMYAMVTVVGERWPAQTAAVALGLAVGCLVRLGARWYVSAPVGLAAGVLLFLTAPYITPPASELVGAAVALGCVLHCLGDMITRQGVPILAPLVPVKGKRWWNFRLPLWMTFRAGSTPEKVIVGLFLGTSAVAALQVAGVA